MVMNTCNPSTSEEEAGRSGVQSQPLLNSKFKDILGHMREALSQNESSDSWVKLDLIFVFLLF